MQSIFTVRTLVRESRRVFPAASRFSCLRAFRLPSVVHFLSRDAAFERRFPFFNGFLVKFF